MHISFHDAKVEQDANHSVTLSIVKMGDGLGGRRIMHDKAVWYERKALSRASFWSRHTFKLVSVVDCEILAEYHPRAVFVKRLGERVKHAYDEVFKDSGHEHSRWISGIDTHQYMLVGHALSSKLDLYLIHTHDEDEEEDRVHLATFWCRRFSLYAGSKRGEMVLYEPEHFIKQTHRGARPTEQLDDALVHIYAFQDVLQARGADQSDNSKTAGCFGFSL